MSAWIVNKEHIDVLVKGRRCYGGGPNGEMFDPNEAGRMLWRENLRSVAARYPGDKDGERPGPIEFRDADVEEYEYRDPGFKPTPGELFKALGCYEYQSCEHPEWEASEARKWCRETTDLVVGSMYEGAWGWDADSVSRRSRGEVVAL